MSSDISGKQGTRFLADDEINFLAAKQTHQERSNNKSSGWNAGVSASYGSDGFAFGVKLTAKSMTILVQSVLRQIQIGTITRYTLGNRKFKNFCQISQEKTCIIKKNRIV